MDRRKLRERLEHAGVLQQPVSQGQSNSTVGDNVELSEGKADQPAQPQSDLRIAQHHSWQDNLTQVSSARLADVGAPPPTTDSSDGPSNRTLNGRSSDEESATADRSPHPPKPEPEQSPTVKKPSARLTELYTLSWLTFFALLGTLARLGVEAITEYPDAPVTSRVLWANLGGSLFMGFLVEDRNLFGLPGPSSSSSESTNQDQQDESKLSATHLKHKKTIPLYVGLTTGFCGSFTSFSSFIRDIFLALTNDLPNPSTTTPYHTQTTPPHPRNGGFSLLAALAILILHPALSLAALKTGAHLALLTRHFLTTTTTKKSSSTTTHTRTIVPPRLHTTLLNPLSIPLAIISWLVIPLILTIIPPHTGPSPTNWRTRAPIPLLFAPPGCILRFYLSKHLNRPSSPNFPLGTFAANILGTLVLAISWDLQHANGIGAGSGVGSGTACAVLSGIQAGFCGCLSTVSTWVVEISGSSRRAGWIYGGRSVGVGVGVVVLVMGGMGWTVGFGGPVCG